MADLPPKYLCCHLQLSCKEWRKVHSQHWYKKLNFWKYWKLEVKSFWGWDRRYPLEPSYPLLQHPLYSTKQTATTFRTHWYKNTCRSFETSYSDIRGTWNNIYCFSDDPWIVSPSLIDTVSSSMTHNWVFHKWFKVGLLEMLDNITVQKISVEKVTFSDTWTGNPWDISPMVYKYWAKNANDSVTGWMSTYESPPWNSLWG